MPQSRVLVNNVNARAYTYQEALLVLFRDVRYDGRGLKYRHPERSQERMREILARLGHPERRFRSVHITGTKGKGSTSAFIESILRGSGYRTGLFTSPHLHTFRERIRVDGLLIGPGELAALIGRLQPHFDAIPDLSVFDKITALAFQHFADVGVEWAVVEVGLGGRLDSTNVLLPAVCGITRISRDHTHVLGDTIEQIAYEKAGIIKPHTPVYTGPQRKAALRVIREVAHQKNAPLHRVVPLVDIPLPLIGVHQQVNAAIAVGMVAELARGGLIRHDPAQVAEGLGNTIWPGRFELLPQPGSASVSLLVDCAHNVDSLNLLLATLQSVYPQRPLTFIFGVNRDKCLAPMLERLLGPASRIVLVQSHHPKALPLVELRREVEAVLAVAGLTDAVSVQASASMARAIDMAAALTPPDGLLVGAGSVFVAAELREAWHARHPGVFPEGDWVYEAHTDPRL